jgi:excisionase family DNA binding protein
MSDHTSNSTIIPPAALSLSEFCKHVRISQSLAFKLIRDGKLRSVKVGRRTIIPSSEVNRLLAGEMR